MTQTDEEFIAGLNSDIRLAKYNDVEDVTITTNEFARLLSIIDAQAKRIEELDEDNIKFAKWIFNRHSEGHDHACAQCRPHSEILKPGFICGYHSALIVLAEAAHKSKRTEQ